MQNYLKKIAGMGLLFLLLVSVAFAFDFSICDTPERAIEELGDDYYAFCERNVAPDFYSDTPEFAGEYTPSQTIFIPSAPEGERVSNYTYDEDMVEREPSSVAAVLGFILLLFLLGLIIWRTNHHKHITTLAINKLLPTMRQYAQAGWTKDQLSQLLLEKGYELAFINKLLKALERKP